MVDLVDQKRNLPVLDFVLQILTERFPELEVRKGSAIYNLMVLPISLMLEPFYDRLTVLVNNQSLLRFEDMLEHEVDLLLANFFVSRQTSSTATGSIRVFFSSPVDVVISTSATFSTGDGATFIPVARVTITSGDMALREQEGLFFVDVPVTATSPGEDFVVDENTITQFSGVPQAVKATNPVATIGGSDVETNSEFVIRAQNTLATRTITSATATRAVIQDNFDTVKSVEVIGFGDEGMTRDVVSVVISTAPIFEARFARKMNVPFVDRTAGEPVLPTTPGALTTGVLVDTIDATTSRDPYFFHKLIQETDGFEQQIISVQVGDLIRILDESDLDFGDLFRVEQILFGELSQDPTGIPDELPTHGLVLNKAFSTQSTWTGSYTSPVAAEVTKTPYTIGAKARVDGFHIGGKVDIFINSSNIRSETVVVNALEANSISPTFSDVPISTEALENSLGQPLFRDNRSFLLPFLGIQKIEVVDSTDESVILDTLIAQEEFKFLTFDPELRFTDQEDSIIRIIGQIGATVKITYLTNGDVSAVQAFVDDPERRDVTKDVLVKSVRPLNTDVALTYSGGLTETEARELITDFIASRTQGGELAVNDIVSLLNVFGATKVNFPVTLTTFTFDDSGELESQSSTDSVSISKRDIFAAVPDLSITRV